MRKKELATLMEALPSALETLAVARCFGEAHGEIEEATETTQAEGRSLRRSEVTRSLSVS